MKNLVFLLGCTALFGWAGMVGVAAYAEKENEKWRNAANSIFWAACAGAHDGAYSVEARGLEITYTCHLMDSGTAFSLPTQTISNAIAARRAEP